VRILEPQALIQKQSVAMAQGRLPGQDTVNKIYNGVHVQVAVACLIGANFLTNIVEKEIDPAGTKYASTFEAFELFYNICFTIELVFNMYAHWWKPFWASNWNIFDVVVVTIGVVNTIKLPLPPAFSMLRMMRAFRVFRLFKRVRSLNKIIVAIVHAIPGVANAFLILAIVMSIYAILAVEFYLELGADCKQIGGDARWLTPRGYCAGFEYFGTFSKSLYSFFQVLTGESWSEAVARPAIFFYYEDPIRAIGGGLFFVSYVLITAFVLTNVVVAVLLDKMVDPETSAATDLRQGLTSEDEDTDGAEDGEKTKGDDSTVPNGEAAALLTPEDLNVSMTSVTNQVEQLTQVSERMSSELDNFRSDMAALRAQVASMIQCMPGATDNSEQKIGSESC
jgi:hypothetical protein